MPIPAILPLALGALVLVGCAKAAKDIRNARPLISLTGSEWALVGATKVEQFVAFKSEGEIIGYGGCNQFFGQYTQNDRTLTIGALASTKKFCGDIMQVESDFIQKLQATRRFEATHIELRLFDMNDAQLMQLRRRDWD